MNKTVKGSLAGAAGVALLMGGFGSYALWSQDATLNSSTVNSGHLTVSTSTGTYADATPGAANTTWDKDSDLMVPGDVVTYKQTFSITGTGKNLKGYILLNDPAAMSGNFAGQLSRTVTLSDPDGNGGNFVVQASPNNPLKYNFSAPFGDSLTTTATVTYTFASATGTTGKDATATTPDTTFTIAQG